MLNQRKRSGAYHAFYLWTAGVKQTSRLGKTGNPVVDSYQTINLADGQR